MTFMPEHENDAPKFNDIASESIDETIADSVDDILREGIPQQ